MITELKVGIRSKLVYVHPWNHYVLDNDTFFYRIYCNGWAMVKFCVNYFDSKLSGVERQSLLENISILNLISRTIFYTALNVYKSNKPK